uniref:PH domain-containing protein n=1 Tax=Ditylenchus dipsaci TaxID=166011 RepID=A0A915D3P0_9BILA
MERTNEVMLIILAKKKPDMCRLFFSNKNEMHQWVQTIKSARLIAPKYVRTANGPQEIETSKPVGDDAGDTDPDETAYNENISKWQKRLEILFNERMKQEEQLKDYFDERMKFFDSIRRHLKNFPAKTPKSDSALVPSTAKVRENRDIERLKSVLQTSRSTLDQLIETSQKARDSDLASFFDDLFELGQGGQPSSSSNDSSANYSDENEENNGNKKRANKPRRARTYHGTADSQSSSSSTRRHTTVPKVGSEDLPSGEEDASFNDQVDEDIRKLPLRVGSKARKAATDLIRENVSMRIENNKLRKEIALQDLHIASLRAQRKPRQERDFKMEYEKRMDNLKARQEQLDNLETALKQREAQMETMSSTFTMTSDTNSKPLSSTMRGKMPTFRSGSAIHELNTADSVKSGNLTDRPFSTVEKSSNSDIHVMPRHLVVKTETKLADKRRSKK